MVKLKYPFSRLITSLLSLTLVSAVLMLGSPAFAHELSGSTCAADVVFLWNQESFRNCSTIKSYQRFGSNYSHCYPRPPLLYGHTRAVINTLAATGADVRFGTADQGFDPALMLAAGSYGDVGTEYLGSTPGYDDKGVYGMLRLGAFSDSTRVSRERIAHDEEIEQQLFAAQTRDSLVFRYHNPKGLSAAEHNTAAKNAVGKFGKPDHTFGDQSRGGYNSHHQLDNRPPTAAQVAKDTRTFTENVFGRMGPNGIAFDSKGNAYVLNAGRNEVYKMSHLGAVMAKWGGHGSGPGKFAHMAAHGGMMGIAIGPKHNVFITDQGNFRVQVFSQSGTFLSEFGTKGRGNGMFLKPTYVAADSKGNVYVTDWERRDIQKFVPEIVSPGPGTPYKWALTFGGKETKDYEQGRFYKKADGYGPNGIAVNSKDQIHVSDSGNCRVQVFDSEGKFTHQIPSAPYTVALNLTGIRAQKAYIEKAFARNHRPKSHYIKSACAYDRDGKPRPHPHKVTETTHSAAHTYDIKHGPDGHPQDEDHPGCPTEYWLNGTACTYKSWGYEMVHIPARDSTAPLLDPSQKCKDKSGVFYDNPTEYWTESLTAYVKSGLRNHRRNYARGTAGASPIPPGNSSWRFSEEHIAAVYPAAAGAGAGASAATGPVDVCNNLEVKGDGKVVTQYDAAVNFRGQHPVAWGVCTNEDGHSCRDKARSAQPEYPVFADGGIKWPGPGAIAIGKDDALFVVDGPAIGTKEVKLKYASGGWVVKHRRPTQMMIKQFSAAGEFLGTVAAAGGRNPDLPALAIRRPKSSTGDAEFGTVTMNTTFKKDVMGRVFNVTQKLTANKDEALKAVTTGMAPNSIDGMGGWPFGVTPWGLEGYRDSVSGGWKGRGAHKHSVQASLDRGGDLFGLHQLATSGGPTPRYGTGTGKAPGWRTDEDVARIVVWYGGRPAGNESANVDEVITELQNNDVTVIAVNTTGHSLHSAMGFAGAISTGRGTGLDCPELNRVTLKAAPMLGTDLKPSDFVGIPVWSEGQKRVPSTISEGQKRAFARLIKGRCKAGGPTGLLCEDGCWFSQDGEGQATRIIDATGGAYQHLSIREGVLEKPKGMPLTKEVVAKCDSFLPLSRKDCKEALRSTGRYVGYKHLKSGKGNYEPTVKFILDQFNPPPMAGSSVPVTVSNDGKTLYVAKFDDGKATGDLEAWSLSAASIPTSVKWSSASKLDARSSLASTRNALTYSEGRGVKMEWDRLGDYEKYDFLSGRSEESQGQARLKFLLGDRSKEGSEFHQRSSVLGPIARSAPVYVGAPNQAWLTSVGGSAYANFLKKAAKRKAMVYVGSNGGALHGFDAASGEETFAYYPGALYRTGHGGYHDLALAGFKHKTKYVDGVPSVSDVKVDGKWKTVLVSSLGGGGRGLFALDVTDPSELNDANTTVLWEFTHKDDPHLGYTHSKPILRQMNNGKWAAIIGNGQWADADDATAGQAQLFIVYLDGPGGDGVWDLGRDYLRISTGEGAVDTALLAVADAAAVAAAAAADVAVAAAKRAAADSAKRAAADSAATAAALSAAAAAAAADAVTASRNALFAPIGIDHDVTPDGRFDVIYAGDLYGNLWRFDVSGSSASSWSSPVEPFFKGDKTRPITATPAVGIAPAGVTDLAPIRTGALEKTHSVMVFFGSGRLLADADKAASIVNRFYGVYDDGSKIGLTEANLTEQQRTYSTATARVYQNDLKVGYTRSAGSSKRGWYITLPDDGERVIDRALVKGELVYFNTVLPDTLTCDAGGKGWENVVQMVNGGSARGAQWDVNQNGSLDAGDTHAGISFAGRKTAQGQPGAPKIVGGRLFTPLTDKIRPGVTAGPRDHFQDTGLASGFSSTSGRISWMELQPKQTD